MKKRNNKWNEIKCVLYSPRKYHLLPGQEPWSRLGGEVQEAHFLDPKVHILGIPHLPQINPGYRPVNM